ncbi:MAG TPA: TOMM precursor leader peptide-binding protein [Bryobacteraceae bacterium]|jgi:thiazole/oxazole-forming peptide maturase SagC family component
MELQLETKLYRSVPARVVQFDDGAILKRGAMETRVRGERALEVLQYVLEATREGLDLDELRDRFAEIDRPGLEELLRHLMDRRILVHVNDTETQEPSVETPESIFYWDFNQDALVARERLRDVRVAIAGVNEVSLELDRALRRSGYENIRIIDALVFRNSRLFTSNGVLKDGFSTEAVPLNLDQWGESVRNEGVDCVIATSDHGGAHWMRKWNEMCVGSKTPFFPVCLQDMVGYIGPLVIPGETACTECLRSRQNSNLESPAEERALEPTAFEGQSVTSFHPCMPAAVAQVAAMELIKFHSKALPYSRVGTLIELNLLGPFVTTHKILRVPNCTVCGRLNKNSGFGIGTNQSFMPGNQRASA